MLVRAEWGWEADWRAGADRGRESPGGILLVAGSVRWEERGFSECVGTGVGEEVFESAIVGEEVIESAIWASIGD